MERQSEWRDDLSLVSGGYREEAVTASITSTYRQLDELRTPAPVANPEALEVLEEDLYMQFNKLFEHPENAAQIAHQLLTSDQVADRTLACHILIAPHYLPPRALSIDTGAHWDRAAAHTPLQGLWMGAITKGVDALARLPIEWDGPGSLPPDRMHVASLIRTLIDLNAFEAPAPHLVPLATGGVQAEWHFSNQSMEIGINHDGTTFAVAPNPYGQGEIVLDQVALPSKYDLDVLRQALLSLTQRNFPG